MSTMENQLEAIIFSEGGEIPINTVCELMNIDAQVLCQVVDTYNERKGGMILIKDDKKILMRVSSEYSHLVEKLKKDQLNEDISKASLEVLAIVLYSDGVGLSASEIDHIRGVNSSYILRQLTIRGLLHKSKKGLSYVYSPTAELLSLLGIGDINDLPQIADIQMQIKNFKEHDK